MGFASPRSQVTEYTMSDSKNKGRTEDLDEEE